MDYVRREAQGIPDTEPKGGNIMILEIKKDIRSPKGNQTYYAGDTLYAYKNKGFGDTWILCRNKSRMSVIETVGDYFVKEILAQGNSNKEERIMSTAKVYFGWSEENPENRITALEPVMDHVIEEATIKLPEGAKVAESVMGMPYVYTADGMCWSVVGFAQKNRDCLHTVKLVPADWDTDTPRGFFVPIVDRVECE